MKFTAHTPEFWNDRYKDSEYVYGTEPNLFLTKQKHRLQPGMKALAVGDGEGRNSVWLASQGLKVLALDFSAVALTKAQALAAEKGVQIQTKCVDLTEWNWAQNEYDVIVSIFLHFAPNTRSQMHRAMLQALKPSGILILEAYNLKQIEYQAKYSSGGPPNVTMLYNAQMLQQDFAQAEVLYLSETITQLSEGKYHNGSAAVIRAVIRKKEN